MLDRHALQPGPGARTPAPTGLGDYFWLPNPVVDRFIPGDDDLHNLENGVGILAEIGLNGIEMDPPNEFTRSALAKAGQTMTSGGTYSPPGAEPDTGATFNTTPVCYRFHRTIACAAQLPRTSCRAKGSSSSLRVSK